MNVPNWIYLLKKIANAILPNHYYSVLRSIALDIWFGISNKPVPQSKIYIDRIKNKSGLEIGGPSFLYKSLIPIYKYIKKLDNVNWASKTVNNPFMLDGPGEYKWYMFNRGRNIICEADSIPVSSSSYEFVISAQVLEHLANPIKALIEWHRILTKDGFLICEVPIPELTFDYKRPITSFQHIIDDFERNTGHDDLTHVDEVVELTHDFKKPTYKNKDELREICLNNKNNRLMHHHVFDLDLLMSVIEFSGFEIIDASIVSTGYIVLAKKTVRNG